LILTPQARMSRGAVEDRRSSWLFSPPRDQRQSRSLDRLAQPELLAGIYARVLDEVAIASLAERP
jgi:hypothetical protein